MTAFPQSKVKEIALTDPDVKDISKPAIEVLKNAAEIFAAQFFQKCFEEAHKGKRITSKISDFIAVVNKDEVLNQMLGQFIVNKKDLKSEEEEEEKDIENAADEIDALNHNHNESGNENDNDSENEFLVENDEIDGIEEIEKMNQKSDDDNEYDNDQNEDNEYNNNDQDSNKEDNFNLDEIKESNSEQGEDSGDGFDQDENEEDSFDQDENKEDNFDQDDNEEEISHLIKQKLSSSPSTDSNFSSDSDDDRNLDVDDD